jgi:HSP20 family protein
MSLAPWSPFRDMADLARIGRWFDDAARWMEPVRSGARLGFPVDVFETADDVIVRADLPGVRQEDIRVQWSAGHLVIAARRADDRPEGATPVRTETLAGEFSRSFELGVAVDPDGLRAEYEDGVLTITAPKAADVKARTVPVGGRGRWRDGASTFDGPRYESRTGRGRRGATS